MYCDYFRVLAGGVTNSMERDTMGFTDTKGDRATIEYEQTPSAAAGRRGGLLIGPVSSVSIEHVSLHPYWILPYPAEHCGVDAFDGAV